MSTVLVTGGAGFIGSHTVDRLVDAGYDVTVLDNLTDQVHDEEPAYLNDAAEYVWGDVRDRELLTKLLTEADRVCHLASAVGVGQSMYEIEHYVDVNTAATARLLDIVVNEEIDLDQFVVASSMSIYGEGAYFCEHCSAPRYPSLREEAQLAAAEWEQRCEECGEALTPRPTPESKPRESTSVYAITKKDQEELSLSVGRAYDIPTVALRYFNVYGSRQALGNPYTGVCAIFSSRIKNDNPPVIFEDGHQTRDFIHVKDIARANQLALEADVDQVALNVGTGTPVSVREIAEVLIDLYDAGLEPDITHEFRQGDIRHCYADTTRVESVLGFDPRIDFEDGMEELVVWGREQNVDDRFEDAHAELEERGLVGE